MEKLIKQILNEEMNNLKVKKFLDKVVFLLLDDLYIQESQDDIVSFGSVSEMRDIGVFHDEVELLINSKNEYKKLGWDSREYEDDDETYYFRVDEPHHHYNINEFELEVVYDWLESLYKTGRIGYDEEMGDYGEWIILNNDFLLRSKSNSFYCTLWKNEMYQSYVIHNCDSTTHRVTIMRFINKLYGIEDSNEVDYIINEFYRLLPQKIESMGLKVYKNNKNDINESIIDDFIVYSKEELSLGDDFKVNLLNRRDNDMDTLANYNINDKEINVLGKNRSIPDIIRSIAHEMVHHKQNTRGDLRGVPNEGESGSPWEDEANAKAGELVRNFGEQNPEIYDL